MPNARIEQPITGNIEYLPSTSRKCVRITTKTTVPVKFVYAPVFAMKIPPPVEATMSETMSGTVDSPDLVADRFCTTVCHEIAR